VTTKLTPRQAAFVRAYQLCGNQTQAAREAGYRGNDNALHVTGHRLLRNATVAAALAKREEKAEQHALLRREARLEWLAKVVSGEVPDIEVGKDLAGNVVSAEPSPAKLKDRLAAMNLLGKSTGDHVIKHVGGSEGEAPIKHEVRIDAVSKLSDDEVIAAAKALLGKEPT
jgi:hypothetical protein